MAKTLLLADDSLTIQRVVGLTFAQEDVRVVAFGSGDEAVKWLEEELPDIVLADVGMAQPDGYAVSRHVKQSARLHDVPVLLLSGAFEPLDDRRAKESACDGILVKPFEPQQLVARVSELLLARPVTPTTKLGPSERATVMAREPDIAVEDRPSAPVDKPVDKLVEKTAPAAASSVPPAPVVAAVPERTIHDEVTTDLAAPIADLQSLDAALAAVESAEVPVAAAPEPPELQPLPEVPSLMFVEPDVSPRHEPVEMPAEAANLGAIAIDWNAPLELSHGTDDPLSLASNDPFSSVSLDDAPTNDLIGGPGWDLPPAPKPEPVPDFMPLVAVSASETPAPAPAAVVSAAAVPAPVSLAGAFTALLAAEQAQAQAARPNMDVTEALLEEVVRRVLQRLTGDVVRQTVLETAERLIKDEIAKIQSSEDE